jgi:hypothetical protein
MNLFEDTGIYIYYLEELLQSRIEDFPHIKDISCDSGYDRDILCFVRSEKGYRFSPEEKAEIEQMIFDTAHKAGLYISVLNLRVMFTYY